MGPSHQEFPGRGARARPQHSQWRKSRPETIRRVGATLANVAFQTGGAYSREEAESVLPDLDAWGKLLDDMERQLAALWN